MVLDEPTWATTRSASWVMDTCSEPPRLKTWLYAAVSAIRACRAGTTSWTWQKQRACWPVPNTVSGWPGGACPTQPGTTMPQRAVGRGAETARLLAGPEHGEWLAGERLPDEARDNHAVAAGLARADGVEQPDYDRLQTVFHRIQVGEGLVERLGLSIGPAVLQRRPDVAVVVFPQPDLGVLAVDLAGRRDQDARAVPECAVQDVLRPVQVGTQALERPVQDREGPHRGGEVIDGVGPADEFVHDRRVENRTLNELK